MKIFDPQEAARLANEFLAQAAEDGRKVHWTDTGNASPHHPGIWLIAPVPADRKHLCQTAWRTPVFGGEAQDIVLRLANATAPSGETRHV